MSFAEQLRGIAALMMVVTHLLGVYFHQDIVASALGTTPLALDRPRWTLWLFPAFVNWGPLGVGLFFLISGFVIPFSVQKLSARPFLLSRAMRIYPTYWVCLGCGVLAILWSGQGSVEHGLGWRRLLANALLVFPHIQDAPSLDLVNWTLAVEIKFYLLVAALGRRIGQSAFHPLVITATAILAFPVWFSLWQEALTPPVLLVFLRGFAADMPYLIYMLVGTLFYKHHHGLLSGGRMMAQASLLLPMFVVAWWWSPLRPQFPQVTINYFYALLIFGTAYLLRSHFRPQPLLEALAAISYPLYALHNLLGYALLQHLQRAGWSYNQALPLVLLLVFALAYIVHRGVEEPTQRAGRSWAQRLQALRFSPSGRSKEESPSV